MTDEIKISRAGDVQIVRMNRPAKKNALTRDMYDAMASALTGADRDDGVAVSVITAPTVSSAPATTSAISPGGRPTSAARAAPPGSSTRFPSWRSRWSQPSTAWPSASA